jgi:hypothetical protein
MDDQLNKAKEQFHSFVDKSFAELARQLQTTPGTTEGDFKPSMVPNYVPSHVVVKRGTYDSRCGQLHVEVLMQDLETGLIHVEIYDEDDPFKRFDFISTGMFVRLFRPKSVIDYILGKPSADPCQ